MVPSGVPQAFFGHMHGFPLARIGAVADFCHMKHLKHLDLRTCEAEAMMFPPSLEFLALHLEHRGVTSWMLPPYSVSKEHGLMLPNLKTLICGTIVDAALLLRMSLEDPPYDFVSQGETTGTGSKLETLHIRYSAGDSFSGVVRLGHFDRLEDLVDLSLPTADMVDEEWAPWVAAYGHRLQKINLEDSDVTGYGLKKIIEATPQMRSVNVRRCTRLSTDASQWVAAKGIRIDNSMGREEKRGGRKVRY